MFGLNLEKSISEGKNGETDIEGIINNLCVES